MLACQTLISLTTGFSKALTASDTNRRFSRLIIPTHSAQTCLEFLTSLQKRDIAEGNGCRISIVDTGGDGNGNIGGPRIGLRFRRWRSSGSFVLIEGWMDYVKSKDLRAGDVVIFWWDSAHSTFCIAYQRTQAKAVA